jgi:hypothetical protein
MSNVLRVTSSFYPTCYRKVITMRSKDPNPFSTPPPRASGPSVADVEASAKLNSFESALAKKGVSLQAAIQKSSGGSTTTETYFADINGHRLR